MSIFRDIFRRFFRQGASVYATPIQAKKPKFNLEGVPKYPPYNPGLPAVHPDQIVESQRELIDRLKKASATTDSGFEATYLAAIRSYAAFVHLLPASEAHHHRGTGGLFRHGIEAGLHGALSADQKMFVLDEPPSIRRKQEPIWKFAAFLASLNHDIGKPLSDLEVLDTSGTLTWNPFLEPLHTWASRNGIDHYHIRFRAGRHQDHETIGILVLEQVLDAGLKQYLHEAGPKMMHWMVAAIANTHNETEMNPFRDLVIKADRDSTERDLRVNGALQSNMPSIGIAAEKHILDAIRRLVRSKEWTINKRGARIWVIDGNLYIAWNAARDIVRIINDDKTPGVPRDPHSIADMLIERGLAVARETFDGTRRYWHIVPDELNGTTLRTIRLATPDLVIDPVPGSVPGQVLAGDGEDEVPATSSASSKTDEKEESTNDSKTIEEPASGYPEKAEEEGEPEIKKESSGENRSDTATPKPRQEPKPKPEPEPEKPKAAIPVEENPFANKGIIGEIVNALLDEIKEGTRPPDSVRQEAGMVVMGWPDAFKGFGMEANAVLNEFKNHNLTEPDPTMPTRFVRELESGKAVVIKHREGTSLLAMVKKAQSTKKVEDKPVKQPPPEKKETASSPKKGDEKGMVEAFIQYYLAEDVKTPFPLAKTESGVAFPIAQGVGNYAQKHNLQQRELRTALVEAAEGGHPKLRLRSQGKRIELVRPE